MASEKSHICEILRLPFPPPENRSMFHMKLNRKTVVRNLRTTVFLFSSSACPGTPQVQVPRRMA